MNSAGYDLQTELRALGAKFMARNSAWLESMLAQAWEKKIGLYVESYFEMGGYGHAIGPISAKQEFRFCFTNFPPQSRMDQFGPQCTFYSYEDIRAAVLRCCMEGV